MSVRPITERVNEIKSKREKTKKKLEQYDEQIKRLEKQDAETKRKERTHALIVCGAELASLFGKVLDENEILSIVNFLRTQKDAGFFALEKENAKAMEQSQKTEETTKENDDQMFGGMFNF